MMTNLPKFSSLGLAGFFVASVIILAPIITDAAGNPGLRRDCPAGQAITSASETGGSFSITCAAIPGNPTLSPGGSLGPFAAPNGNQPACWDGGSPGGVPDTMWASGSCPSGQVMTGIQVYTDTGCQSNGYQIFCSALPAGYNVAGSGSFGTELTIRNCPACSQDNLSVSQSRNVVPPRPDLITQHSSIDINGTLTAGNSLSFSGTVKNQGSGSANAGSVGRWCIDNPDCFNSSTGSLGETTFAAFSPGFTSGTRTSASWIASAGSHTIYWCADVTRVIDESNESNNCSSRTFTVAGPSTGDVFVGIKIDGANPIWQNCYQPINFSFSPGGWQGGSDTCLDRFYADMPTGTYTFNYSSGGPAGKTFTGITYEGGNRTLSAGGAIAAYYNFITPAQICSPGTTRSCSTAQSCPGTQTCSSDGQSWGSCADIPGDGCPILPPGPFSVTVTPSSCPAPINNHIDWTNSANAASYEVRYCTGGGCTPTIYLGSTTNSNFIHANVSQGTSYTYRVTARNGSYARQVEASAATPTCKPNLTIVSGSVNLDTGSLVQGNAVTFQAAVRNNGTKNATGTPTWNNRFQIDLDSATFTGADVTLSPHATLTSLAPGFTSVVVSGTWTADTGATGSHTLRVCADIPGNVVDESNESTADNCEDWRFTICQPTNPAAPSLVAPLEDAVRAVSGSTLDWSPVSSWGTSCVGSQRYRVLFENNDSTPDVPVPAVWYTQTSGITKHTTGALDEGSRYYWRIQAHNGSLATFSETRSFRVRPNAPSGLVASPACDVTDGRGDVTLTWQDNSNTETGYRIQRSADGGGTWVTIPLLGPNPGTGAMSYMDRNLTSGVDYSYRVRAEQTGLVDSLWSPVADTGLIQCPPGSVSTFTAAPQCPAPGNADVQLTWTDVYGETSYRIQRATDPAFTVGLTVFDRPANSTSFLDTAVALTTPYYYRVRARNGAGNSPWTNATPFPVATTACPTANVAPVANAGPDQALIAGTPHTQNGTVSDTNNNLASYDWDFISCIPGPCPGNPAPVPTTGGAAPQPAPLTFTPAPGIYTLRLTATDLQGLTGFGQAIITATAAPTCGDGSLDVGEQCDDGNTIGGDGCSATCQNEADTLSVDLTPNPQVADLAGSAILQANVALNARLIDDTGGFRAASDYTFTFDCDGAGGAAPDSIIGSEAGGNVVATKDCIYTARGIYDAQVVVSRLNAASGSDTERIIIKPPLPIFKEVIVPNFLNYYMSSLLRGKQ